jgi:hypothetical protein
MTYGSQRDGDEGKSGEGETHCLQVGWVRKGER